MESILGTVLRTILILFILFVITRLMGKKQVSQMNIYDYIIGITMGSIAADISLDIEKDLIAGILCLAVYGGSAILVTILTLKSITIRKFINGVPTILINNGKIIYNNLKKEGIDINDLEEEARQNGYFDLSKINYAILEISGKISFLAKAPYEKVTRDDIKMSAKNEEIKSNVIIDGTLIESNLKAVNRDSKWLSNYLEKHGYKDYKDILLMTIDKSGRVNIFPKCLDNVSEYFL